MKHCLIWDTLLRGIFSFAAVWMLAFGHLVLGCVAMIAALACGMTYHVLIENIDNSDQLSE